MANPRGTEPDQPVEGRRVEAERGHSSLQGEDRRLLKRPTGDTEEDRQRAARTAEQRAEEREARPPSEASDEDPTEAVPGAEDWSPDSCD